MSNWNALTNNVGLCWIDALCIDQGCFWERQIQVSKMAQIYSQASNVLVWLGACERSSRDAIAYIKEVELGNRDGEGEIRLNSKEKHGISEDLLREASLKLCSALFNRGYWTRMWIVQELILARKWIMACGKDIVNGDVIDLFVLGTPRMNATKAHSILHSKTTYDFTLGSTQPRLDQNIVHFGGRDCSDLRDQVYALLSISRTDRPITADYRIIDNGELYAMVLESIEWETETSLVDLDTHLRRFLRISDKNKYVKRAFNEAIVRFR
jgi:hypothetical protein